MYNEAHAFWNQPHYALAILVMGIPATGLLLLVVGVVGSSSPDNIFTRVTFGYRVPTTFHPSRRFRKCDWRALAGPELRKFLLSQARMARAWRRSRQAMTK